MKKSTIKYFIIMSLFSLTLFGLKVDYTKQNGFKINAEREAKADIPDFWTESWNDCGLKAIEMGEDGPIVVSMPGQKLDCDWAPFGSCWSISCRPLVPE